MASKKEKIIGIRALEEALENGTPISKVFLQRGKSEDRDNLVSQLKEQEIPFQFVPKEKINRMHSGNHQGVFAWISPVEFYQLDQWLPTLFEEGETPFLAILDGITDVRNFGAIARSAECFGVNGLIIPYKKTVTITEDAVKTSAGSLLNLPVCREKNLKDTLEFLRNSGLNIVGICEKADKEIKEVNFSEPSAVILGAEDKGISPELEPVIDEYIKIPMKGTISSLNVSVSAGIVFYEMVRQSEQK